jgi:hypothetical protein
VLWAASTLQPRSFAGDAQLAVTGLYPQLEVLGAEHIPACGPCLVTCNHYSRPGFGAWWIALAISAAVASHRHPTADPEIHWVMTAAWTFPESKWKAQVLTPATQWALNRLARVYGFVTTPPMPPAPDEVEARAAAVLRTIRLARRVVPQGGMVGLAPEGMNTPGKLAKPPQGAGVFIALLVEAGLPVLPVGVTEREGRLRLSFGQLFIPEIPPGRVERDLVVARQVMTSIAGQIT